MLAHGSGGRMSQHLIETVFKKAFQNEELEPMLDGAILTVNPPGRLAFSTDSFVITPIFFPGGDIGKLAVAGTINDLISCGAVPKYLSVGMIIEEGMLFDDLRRVVESMAAAAQSAGVKIVTGDTKVVEKGSADRLFINTSGIGFIPDGIDFQPARMRAGDKIIVTGTMGDHGLAILAQREGLRFDTPTVSDCGPLHRIGEVLRKYENAVKCVRDPTRGGLATVLNELTGQGGCGMLIEETAIPIRPVVLGACEMLGMDPLYMANEGKLVIVVDAAASDRILAELHDLDEAADAAVIGDIIADPALVLIETELGARRILGMLEGEHLPRIC